MQILKDGAASRGRYQVLGHHREPPLGTRWSSCGEDTASKTPDQQNHQLHVIPAHESIRNTTSCPETYSLGCMQQSHGGGATQSSGDKATQSLGGLTFASVCPEGKNSAPGGLKSKPSSLRLFSSFKDLNLLGTCYSFFFSISPFWNNSKWASRSQRLSVSMTSQSVISVMCLFFVFVCFFFSILLSLQQPFLFNYLHLNIIAFTK